MTLEKTQINSVVMISIIALFSSTSAVFALEVRGSSFVDAYFGARSTNPNIQWIPSLTLSHESDEFEFRSRMEVEIFGFRDNSIDIDLLRWSPWGEIFSVGRLSAEGEFAQPISRSSALYVAWPKSWGISYGRETSRDPHWVEPWLTGWVGVSSMIRLPFGFGLSAMLSPIFVPGIGVYQSSEDPEDYARFAVRNPNRVKIGDALLPLSIHVRTDRLWQDVVGKPQAQATLGGKWKLNEFISADWISLVRRAPLDKPSLTTEGVLDVSTNETHVFAEVSPRFHHETEFQMRQSIFGDSWRVIYAFQWQTSREWTHEWATAVLLPYVGVLRFALAHNWSVESSDAAHQLAQVEYVTPEWEGLSLGGAWRAHVKARDHWERLSVNWQVTHSTSLLAAFEMFSGPDAGSGYSEFRSNDRLSFGLRSHF